MNPTFEACTEQCAAAGTSCAGATFGSSDDSQQECYLYSRIVASETRPAYPIVAAIRTSSSEGSSRWQILQNGGFDGTLTPWTSGRTASGSEFAIDGNTARVIMQLATRAAETGAAAEDSILLQQEISDPVGANTAYYTSLDLTIEPVSTGPLPRKRQASNNHANCSVRMRSAAGDTFVTIRLGDTAGPRTIYGSGTTQSAGIQVILINADCIGTSNVVVRLNNILFFSSEPDSSGPGCDTSLLTNGNFDSELSPWTLSQRTFTSASVSVSGGQAIVRFAANTGMTDAPARLTQDIAMPADQPYRIMAQLVVTIADGSCQVGFATEIEALYFTEQISQSGTIPITYDGVSEIQASKFAVTVNCYSPSGGINSVGIDSVAVVMNLGAECSSSSTTG
jgi:hypothetical protein